TSSAPNGVELIRKALLAGIEAADGADAKITSVGSPRYRIVVNAAEYKTAEDILKRVSATAIKSLEDDGGVAVLKRESK
ncbi:MAG: translation initiation factor IF-2 subunit alpha, partial [Candidatus Methanomethylophilus sp.]|nr:translation initiation factor IF-2 subunit alpha [Methanomethylophilus sp.]